MKDSKGSFNILTCIEKHIQSLKPLLPKQAIICIGEYPIKALLKEADVYRDGVLPIFMEKSSDDIYKWVPDGYNPHLVIGFEDANVDTHFWYNVLPAMAKDHSITDSLKKKSAEKLRGAIFFASISDGVGSAAIPSLTAKFKAQSIDSLSIAVLPSKIQPADAHFNAYSALQMCLATEGSTVLLLSRDQLENYEGVDRKGVPLRGNAVVNYLLSVFLDKELLVPEIAELSRTFNVKLFSALAVTGASYKIYGSLGNMLNAVLLKPLSTFDLSSASLLYVLLRMPLHLKDKIPRAQIELEITNWFKEKTALQSIHISEPIYSDDSSDRIDAVLFIGGFDQTQMFQEFEAKVQKLKRRAVKEGYLTEDWRINMDLNLQQVETVEVPPPQATAEQVTEKAEAPQPEEKISDAQPLSPEEGASRPEAEPETADLPSPENEVAAEKTEIKES
ncbi:MAG: hypothetical protein NWE93_11465 [Candidatus Bathyarchaeota archaeon]|nr:hypothetical protein [Candidatus Bathyarchaeota archaeon]